MISIRTRLWSAIFILLGFIHSSKAAPPDAPSDLRPAWVNNISSVLTWEETPGADSYNVYRFDTGAQEWVLAGGGLTVPMFREEPGQEPPWQYAVTAVNEEGEGSSATTLIENGGWSDMMIMYYDPSWYPWLNGRTSVTLQFSASPVSGVDAFLEFGSASDQLEFVDFHSDYLGSHSFTVTNLSPGTLYFFRVTLTGTDRLGYSFANSFYTLPPNIPGQAYPVSGEAWEDQGPAFIWPSGFDPDLYGPPNFVVVTQPANGTASFDGYSLIYQPNPNFSGTDTFTYAMDDGEDVGTAATVTVTVHPLSDQGVNEDELIEITVPEDSAAAGSVLVTDPDGDEYTLLLTAPPASGTVMIDGTNFVFSAAANFHGTINFSLVAVDDQGFPAVGETAVTVIVTSVNDVPVANAQAVTTPYRTPVAITLGGSDVDQDSLWFVADTLPANGVLTGTAPSLVFMPNNNWTGVTSFAFRVFDGMAMSAPAVVTITVTPPTLTPAAPSGLTCQAHSRRINLAWNDNSNNEDGFKIERSSGGSWSQIATVGRNVRTYSNTGLAANREYSYRVRAYNFHGHSAYSNTASARTLP